MSNNIIMNYQLKDLPITLLAYVLGMSCVGLIYQKEYPWQEAPALAFAMIIIAIPLVQNYASQVTKSYIKKSVLALSIAANLGFFGGVIYSSMPTEKHCSIGERC